MLVLLLVIVIVIVKVVVVLGFSLKGSVGSVETMPEPGGVRVACNIGA